MLGDLQRRLEADGSVTFDVRVRAGAPQTTVTRILADGTVKISVAAVAEDGKANQELIGFLAEQFDVPRTQITMLAGHTSRRKLMRIVRLTA